MPNTGNRTGGTVVRRPSPVILSPDIVALLQDMGLAWDEVRIYQFLLNSSPAISSSIVRETGQSRGRIYEVLRRLAEKGLVREEPTRPIQFHPTPVAEILAKAHLRLTHQLDAVKAAQGIALVTARPDVALPLLAPTRARDVRVFSGRRACHAEWSRMLDGAERFFWITGGERFAQRIAAMPDLLQSLVAAHAKGLHVQVILPMSAEPSAAVQAMRNLLGPEVLIEASVDDQGPLVSCTTENAAMEIISQPDDEVPNKGEDVAIQVSSALFADATKQRIELAEAFLTQKGPGPMYQWMAPKHGIDAFLEAIRGAKEDVKVLGPHEWSTFLAPHWQRDVETYREAKARGVQYRALTSRSTGDVSSLSPFADVWDIRVVDWHPVWLTLVDGRELYQAFTHPNQAGPPEFRQSREPNEIKFYSSAFDWLWTRGEPFGRPVQP